MDRLCSLSYTVSVSSGTNRQAARWLMARLINRQTARSRYAPTKIRENSTSSWVLAPPGSSSEAVSRRTISGVTRFKRAAPMIPRQATARVPQWRLAIRIRRAVNPIVKFLPTIRPLRPFYLHTIPRKAYKKNGRCSFFFDNFDLQGFFPEFSPAPFPCPASPCGIRRSSGRLCLNAG